MKRLPVSANVAAMATPTPMPSGPANRADFVLRARLTEPVRFPDLTERMSLKLASLPHYCARAHFDLWHRRLGAPDFKGFQGVFTPLFHVEIETADVALDPRARLRVAGYSHLARVLDARGELRHLAREGRYAVSRSDGTEVGRARFVNVFTRYDPDPARRRVTELPAELGLGSAPSRAVDVPQIETLLPARGAPELVEAEERVWHYTQTDPNRHVNGMEYLRCIEDFLACGLHERGYDMRTLFPVRARIVYRKPCFRGEGYRREAWFCGEAPLAMAGAVRKAADPAGASPAVAVELVYGQHEPPAAD